ncbi:MAG: DUF4097 family beta strand repeat protein [Lachnospiraceae bacterium]|nr:DUF4097 family beta strand repeat protein [Lachnospiraceae bacterium]
MKKFMKTCAIIALVLLVLGAMLTYIGGSFKSVEIVADVVDNVTNGNISLDLTGLAEWGSNIGESAMEGIERFEETVNYDIDAATIFNDAFEIVTEDVTKSFEAVDITSLEVAAGGCAFTIKESVDENFYVETVGLNKFQSYVEDNTLSVKGTINEVTGIHNTAGSITLHVPAGFVFEEVAMEIGAGAMDLGTVNASKITLEAGAGEILADDIAGEELEVTVGMGECSVDKLQVTKLSGEVGAGNLSFEEVLAEQIELECAMGNLEMEIVGAKEDFNYNIQCGMGNVELGNESYSGLAQDKKVDNGASKNIELDCAMGNVEISFTN